MRSSPDAAPSPATPVIVTLSFPPSGCSQCSPQEGTYTITLKDTHERASKGSYEGSSPDPYVGPQIDISGEGGGNVSMTFDVDASALLPGFIGDPTDQLSVGLVLPAVSTVAIKRPAGSTACRRWG